jgi:hypothetical protein
MAAKQRRVLNGSVFSRPTFTVAIFREKNVIRQREAVHPSL